MSHLSAVTPLPPDAEPTLASKVFGVSRVGGSPARVRSLVREGVPVESLEWVQAAFDVSQQELAGLLGMGAKTLARFKKRGGSLDTKASDRLARLVRVYDRACQTLGDSERATRWLSTSNAALGGDEPRVWIDTDVGAQQVTQVLGRIEHGIVA